jgi:hypothetical protein
MDGIKPMKSWMILSFLAVSACAPDESKLWAEFQLKWTQNKVRPSRKPAQNQPMCFESRFQETMSAGTTPQQWFKEQTGVEIVEQGQAFTADQWKTWWKFAHLVPPSMLGTERLKRIVHIPKDKVPASWKAEGICAKSIPDGFEISDDCLSYSMLMHEFAHQFIWQKVLSNPQNENEAWKKFLKFSDWKLEEFVNEVGVTQWRWMSDETAKFVSIRARHSPVEDLSETIAYFRTQGDGVKERAPDKYSWVKSYLYYGQSFDLSSLKESYTSSVVRGVFSQFETWATPCLRPLAASEVLTIPPSVTDLKVKVGLPQEMLSQLNSSRLRCLEQSILNEISTQLDAIRTREPEGCKVLSSTEVVTEIVAKAIPKVTTVIPALIDIEGKLSGATKGLGLFKEALVRDFQVQRLIQDCIHQEEPAQCYRDASTAKLKAIEGRFKTALSEMPDEVVQAEIDEVQAKFSFDEALKMLRSFYVKLADPVMADAESAASEIWKRCEAEKSGPARSSEPAKGAISYHFAPGERFISQGLSSCLDRETTNSLKNLQTQIEKGQAEKFEFKSRRSMRLLWNHGLIPVFERIYTQRLDEIHATQKEMIAKMIAEKNVTFDPDTKEQPWNWLSCKRTVAMQLSQGIELPGAQVTAIGPLVDARANQICARAREQYSLRSTGKESVMKVQGSGSPKKDFVSNAAITAPSPELWKTLEQEWVQEMTEHFQECRRDVYSTPRLKRFCLFYARVQEVDTGYRMSIWERTRARVVARWMKSPNVIAEQQRLGVNEKAYEAAVRQWIVERRQNLIDATLVAFGTIAAETE